MKQGSPLSDVMKRVDRQARQSRDFVAHSRHLRLVQDQDRHALVLDDGAGILNFSPTDLVHDQLADATGVPAAYYRRMLKEAPELLSQNVNGWLARSDQRRLIRTIQDPVKPVARALLSDRYRRLDHQSLMEAILPVLHAEKVTVVSSELTEKRLYVKAITERIQGEVKVGETVMAGISIMNSEVGLGALQVQPLIYTLRCTNGLVVPQEGLRRHHVGRRQEGGDEIQHLLSNETMEADDRAFYLRVRDVAKAALDETMFRRQITKLQEAAGRVVPAAQLEQVVELTGRRFGLLETEGRGILAHLIQGGDLSQWGLCSAITRYSQDVEAYDRASDLERIGGQVIAMEGSGWSSLLASQN